MVMVPAAAGFVQSSSLAARSFAGNGSADSFEAVKFDLVQSDMFQERQADLTLLPRHDRGEGKA